MGLAILIIWNVPFVNFELKHVLLLALVIFGLFKYFTKGLIAFRLGIFCIVAGAFKIAYGGINFYFNRNEQHTDINVTSSSPTNFHYVASIVLLIVGLTLVLLHKRIGSDNDPDIGDTLEVYKSNLANGLAIDKERLEELYENFKVNGSATTPEVRELIQSLIKRLDSQENKLRQLDSGELDNNNIDVLKSIDTEVTDRRLKNAVDQLGSDTENARAQLKQFIADKDDTSVQASLILTRNYMQSYQYYEARKEINACLEKHPLDIRVLNYAAYLASWFDDYKEGKTVLLKHLDLVTSDDEKFQVLNNLSALEIEAENYSEAIKYGQDALKLNSDAIGSARRVTVETNLASSFGGLGQFDKAEELYIKIVDDLDRAKEKNTETYFLANTNLCRVYFGKGKLTEAETKLKDLLKEAMNSESNFGFIHYVLDVLFLVYKEKNDTESFEDVCDEVNIALEKSTKFIKERQGNLYQKMARVSEQMNLADKAEFYMKKVVEIFENDRSGDEVFLITALATLGNFYRSQEKLEESRKYLFRALDLRRSSSWSKREEVAITLNNLAGVYKDLERYDDSLKLYLESLEIREFCYGEEHSSTVTALSNIAHLYLSRNQIEEGTPYARRARDAGSKIYNFRNPKFQALQNLYSKFS